MENNKPLNEVEKRLAKEPKYAQFFLIKNWFNKFQRNHEDSKGFFKGLFDDFKSIFDKSAWNVVKSVDEVNSNLGFIKDAVDATKSEIEKITHKALLKAVNEVANEIKEKELSVNVEAPIVKVPEPKIEVVKESKEILITNKLLEGIANLVNKQTNGDGIKISNSTPQEAIPMVLTDASRKNFYNAISQAISQGYTASFRLPTGQSVRANVDSKGNVLVSDLFDIAQGHVPDTSIVSLIGANDGMQLDQTETIWNNGGFYVFLSADTQLYLTSSDAGDVGIPVKVYGLDQDLNPIVRTAVTNGFNAVPLDGLMFRVFRAENDGSVLNSGSLYIAENGTWTNGVPDDSNKTKVRITNGIGNSQSAIYTIPKGKVGLPFQVTYSLGRNYGVKFSVGYQEPNKVLKLRDTTPVYQTTVTKPLNTNFYPEGTDIQIAGVADNPDTEAYVNLDILLFDAI